MKRTVNPVVKLLGVMFVLYLSHPVYASDVFNGKEVFTRECMACHGTTGEGGMPGLPNFKESQTLFKSDRELMSIVRDGRGVMPSFYGLLTSKDIRDVTAYLRTFL